MIETTRLFSLKEYSTIFSDILDQHQYSFTRFFVTFFYSDAVTTLVKNFHVEAQTATDITFSWDLDGGLESTSYLSTMYICFTYATYTGSGYQSCPSFTYGSTAITNGGHTFSYTFSIFSLVNDNGQFIVYARVLRTNAPSDLYSNQIFVEVGKIQSKPYFSYFVT